MITETEYEVYFGSDTTPSNFTRLEYLALKLIKSIITSDIPAETDDNYQDFVNALCEQIYFLEQNSDLLEDSGYGANYSLGKFSESGSSSTRQTSEIIKRISPNTYTILLDIGLLYVGLC